MKQTWDKKAHRRRIKLRHPGRILIGLTGSLASGKSTALKAFKRAGAGVVSADEIVAQIYKEKKLSKAMLRKTYASSAKKLKELEKWVHPLVRKRTAIEVQRYFSLGKKIVVVEIPLLFEKKLEKLHDLNIFVFCPREIRAKRAIKRGMPKKMFQFLDAKQLSGLEKASRADLILHNFSKPHLKEQVKLTMKWLKSLI